MERTVPFSPVLRTVSTMLLLMICGTASAQDRLDPVGMGRGRASVATVRGLGAVSGNPGALDLPLIDPTTLPQSLTGSLYTLGGAFGSTYLSSSEFADLFGSGTKDRQRLGELLQDERLFANGGINLLTLRYRTGSGTWGFHWGHRIYARVNLPDDFADVLQTLNFGGQDYTFTNRGVGGDWTSELGLSYGMSLGAASESGWFPRIGFGATAKLILGIAHFDVMDNSIVTIENLAIGSRTASILRGGYVFRSATFDGFDAADASGQLLTALLPGTAGSGFGLDVGVSGVLYSRPARTQGGRPVDAVYYGLALNDAGSVSWSTNQYERSAIGINDTIENGQLNDAGIQKYQGTLERTESFSTDLPTAFRAGLGVNLSAFFSGLPDVLLLDVEGEVPLIDRPGNSPDYRLSAGIDWGVNSWLSLRGGIGKVGTNQSDVAFGVGLKPLDWLSLDVATSDINGLFDGARVDFAASLAAGFDL